jgi:hypothetical protein
VLLAVAGCKTTGEDLERPLEVREVRVQVPVPCPALAALGPEPVYADSAEAVAAAETIGQVAALYAAGRLQRGQRLAEYIAAKTACLF